MSLSSSPSSFIVNVIIALVSKTPPIEPLLPVFYPVYRHIVAEDGVNDIVEFVRVVDGRVERQLLSLRSLGLHVVLPEETLFAFPPRRSVLLVNLQIFVAVVILGGVLVLAVNIIQLARTETVEDLRDLVSDGGVSTD